MINQILVNTTDTLKLVVEKLNQNGLSTVFVQNDEKTLVGIITDGILRRYFLTNNIDLNQSVIKVMKKDFLSFPVGTENDIIIKAFNESIKIIITFELTYNCTQPKSFSFTDLIKYNNNRLQLFV